MPMPMHSRPMSPAEMHLPMNYDLHMSDYLPMNYGPTHHLHRSKAVLVH